MQLRRRKKRDLVKHTAVVKTAFRRTVGNLTGNGIKSANYRTGVKVAGKRFHVGSCLSYRSWMMSNSFPIAFQNISVFNIERNVTVCVSEWSRFSVFESTCDKPALVPAVVTVLNQLCFPTGAVGLPLPGVEVRIAMNNATNTTIVEGNQKDTQVNDRHTACWLHPVLYPSQLGFFLLPLFVFI